MAEQIGSELRRYNSSPRQNTQWVEAMTALGLSNLHLGANALDDAQLESVRSKRWGAAFKKAREESHEDSWKDMEWGAVENATQKTFDAATGEWSDVAVEVLMGASPVDHGAIRECFRCKLRPKDGPQRTESWAHGSKNHFAKRFLPERGIPEEAAYDDVMLQMTAKFYGDEFNKWLPPKRIDFLFCFVLQMHERPGAPIYFVERFLEKGTFEKHNSNSGYVNDEHQRNTPQAFSHFSFEASGGRLMVVDIQGIDDLYTDPAIHSYHKTFGDTDLGVRGMALFFESYGGVANNPVSQYLCLPDLEDPQKRFMRTASSGQAHSYVPYEPTTWVHAPLPQASARPASSMLTRTGTSASSSLLTRTGTSASLLSDDGSPKGDRGTDRPGISPRIKTDDSGAIVKSATTDVATPSFLTKPIPPKGEVLAEIYASLADLHDQGHFNRDETPEAIASKGRKALACMAKAAEGGNVQASLTLAELYDGIEPEGMRLSCCVSAGTVVQDPVQAMRYRLAAAKRGHRPSIKRIAEAAAYGQFADAPNYSHAARWYEMATEGDGSGFEDYYLCQAALAALLAEGGHGLTCDNARAALLYSEAAEAAMDLGKGKLSMRYSMAAEECEAAAHAGGIDDSHEFDTADEDEGEELPEVAAMTARLARINQMASGSAGASADDTAAGGGYDVDALRSFLEEAMRDTCAEQPADPYRAMADKCRAAAEARNWLQGAYDEVVAAQPADPYRALADKCREKGVKKWMDQAFAEIVAEQPADPRKALAEKCQRKSISLWLTRTFAEVCAELQPQPQSPQDHSKVMAAMAERCRQKAKG